MCQHAGHGRGSSCKIKLPGSWEGDTLSDSGFSWSLAWQLPCSKAKQRQRLQHCVVRCGQQGGHQVHPHLECHCWSPPPVLACTGKPGTPCSVPRLVNEAGRARSPAQREPWPQGACCQQQRPGAAVGAAGGGGGLSPALQPERALPLCGPAAQHFPDVSSLPVLRVASLNFSSVETCHVAAHEPDSNDVSSGLVSQHHVLQTDSGCLFCQEAITKMLKPFPPKGRSAAFW